MKYIITFILLMLTFDGLSQNDSSESPFLTRSFDKIKNPTYQKDSLVIKETRKSFDKEILEEFEENMSNFICNYGISVFHNTSVNNKKKYHVYQWMTPIHVYIDKAIPKALRKSFKGLIKQIEEQDINNLRISIVKNKDDANYLIKPTDKTFDVNVKFKNEEDIRNYVYNNGVYKYIVGNAKKPRGCILSFNVNNNQSLDVMKKNLNQLFFLSLGKFSMFRNLEYPYSFINAKNQYSEKLSEIDIAFLKLHYNVIYSSPISHKEFNEIIKSKP